MVEFIIIGQGLAGTHLALQLEAQGRSFHLLDQPLPGASSRVAAGLINPVTGRNLSTTWMADTLLSFAFSQYEAWEKQYQHQVLHPLPIWRIFTREKDRERASKLLREGNPYVRPLPVDAMSIKYLNAPLGGVSISPGGWLDTDTFLDINRERWANSGVLTTATIDPHTLQKNATGWRIEGIAGKYLVWATGFRGIDNPYFPNLPFAATKGEILTLQIPDWSLENILIKGHFLIPLGHGYYRLGATYHWHQLDGQPTREAREILLSKLKDMLRCPATIVDHRAGVRPTVTDRKPLIGEAHGHAGMYLFNGLGSKGTTLAPYWAAQLLQHIDEGTPLPGVVRWDRKAKAHNAT